MICRKSLRCRSRSSPIVSPPSSFPGLPLICIARADGMNPIVGPLSYKRDEQSFQKPFSEKTAELIDGEVRKMITNAHRRTTELLTEKKAEVEKVAQLLLAKEVLSRFVSLLFHRDVLLMNSGHKQRRHDCTTRTETVRDGRSLRRRNAR